MSANLCKPVHHINYSTFIFPFVSRKYGKERKKLQKIEYLKKKNSFLDEIKRFFNFFGGLSLGEKTKNSRHKL